jgi:hypothetical protein
MLSGDPPRSENQVDGIRRDLLSDRRGVKALATRELTVRGKTASLEFPMR